MMTEFVLTITGFVLNITVFFVLNITVFFVLNRIIFLKGLLL